MVVYATNEVHSLHSTSSMILGYSFWQDRKITKSANEEFYTNWAYYMWVNNWISRSQGVAATRKSG